MIARRTRLLARTCFAGLFENDLFSSPVSATSGVTWLLAAVTTPGVMVSGSQLFYYARVRTFAPERQDRILFVSQVFHIDFAMAIAAIVTMLIWTSLTPDRRDALVLGPLPVGPGEQARGRLAALTCFVSLFALAVSVPAGLVFTFVTLGISSLVNLLAHVAGHIAAAFLGCLFVFFALVDLQLIAAVVIGPRGVRALTWPLQAAALLAMVAAISTTASTADAILTHGMAATAAWNPAAWFIGVYRWVAGDSRPVFAGLAARAAFAWLLVVGGAIVLYPLAYSRCLVNAISTASRGEGAWSGAVLRWWLRGLKIWLRSPVERALAGFIVASLTRSHAHRFVIGSYVGVALLGALPLMGRLFGEASAPEARYAWFSVPLGLLCWSSAAVRVAMMLPVEPAANWIFKLTEPVDKRRLLSAAVAVIDGGIVLPLAVAFGIGAAIAGGSSLGIKVGSVVLATGLALAELLTLMLRAVPCACTYRPGQLRLRTLWPLYLLTWLVITFQIPGLAVRRADEAARFAWLVGVLLGVWVALRTWRTIRARALRDFVYEELEEPVTTTVKLNAAGV